jgi:hypothetical protein
MNAYIDIYMRIHTYARIRCLVYGNRSIYTDADTFHTYRHGYETNMYIAWYENMTSDCAYIYTYTHTYIRPLDTYEIHVDTYILYNTCVDIKIGTNTCMHTYVHIWIIYTGPQVEIEDIHKQRWKNQKGV